MSSHLPVFYNFINSYNAQVNPSTVHVKNTGLSHYFQRYLLQKAMSVFEWKMEEGWSKDYVLYNLYCYGYVAILNTNKYGVIPQQCSLRGMDIFYRPSHAVVMNPLFDKTYDLKIDKQCTLLRLQPDYGGIMDIVTYYADILALLSETLGTNILNSKLSYVFGASSKTMAESMKKMYDDVASGQPAVFIDKDLFNSDGTPAWAPFTQNVGQNYIASDLLSDISKVEDMFNTDIGIPNANTDKKERMIQDEVNMNQQEVHSKCELWLEQLQDSCKKANEMFGINISVDWRVKPEYDAEAKEVENDTESID